MDWAILHDLNEVMRTQDLLEDPVTAFAAAVITIYAIATFALWFLARPAGVQRLRLACVAALGSAGLGLLLNQAIGHLWTRERPYAAHSSSLDVFSARSHDPSFPSDHATAAFAIAVAVYLFAPRVGRIFLVVAAAIAFSRVLLGVHYPSDVVAGALTGTAAALAVGVLGRPLVVRVTALLARLTDPLLRPLWRAGARQARA